MSDSQDWYSVLEGKAPDTPTASAWVPRGSSGSSGRGLPGCGNTAFSLEYDSDRDVGGRRALAELEAKLGTSVCVTGGSPNEAGNPSGTLKVTANLPAERVQQVSTQGSLGLVLANTTPECPAYT